MQAKTVMLELPSDVYQSWQQLAAEEQADLIEMLRHWIQLAGQRRAWRQDLQDLRHLIQQEGGLQVGMTKEQVVEQMRKTRQEIFEAEYAHLYR